MIATNSKTDKLNSSEKTYAHRTISIIVPLVDKIADATKLIDFVEENCQKEYLQEIIFINTTQNELVYKLRDDEKVRICNFLGASFSKCLELGAFEATGDVLLFLKPGALPVINFDTIILASFRNAVKAGILKSAFSGALLNRLSFFLPLRCVIYFIKADNFFIARRLFYLNTKYVPQKELRSFTSLIEMYALMFRAKLI
jgi:hypothetical protein